MTESDKDKKVHSILILQKKNYSVSEDKEDASDAEKKDTLRVAIHMLDGKEFHVGLTKVLCSVYHSITTNLKEKDWRFTWNG